VELPTEVLVHNELVGMKGTRGTLLQVDPHGYYEVNVRFGERTHRVLLPVAATVIIAQEPEEHPTAAGEDIER
jgi:hypothetical protein